MKRAAKTSKQTASKPKTAKTVTRRRSGTKPATKRPRTKPVSAKARPKVAERAGSKFRVLADLARGQLAILGACSRLSPEQATAPRAAGKWSPREILIHLAFWDEWLLGELPAAIERDELPPPMTAAEENAANAAAVRSAARLDWSGALALYEESRAHLIEFVDRVPATPVARWSKTTAFGRMVRGYASHDLHHAAQISEAARRPVFAPAFAAQRAGAGAKQQLLFELQGARVAVLAAIHGMGGGRAEQPVAEGKWTAKEIVLHLAVRDRVRLDEWKAALAGTPVSWAQVPHEAMAGMNEAHLAPLRHLSWDEAVRLLQVTRDELLARAMVVSAEPEETWSAAHAFGAMLRALPPHDRKHAEQIKNARVGQTLEV